MHHNTLIINKPKIVETFDIFYISIRTAKNGNWLNIRPSERIREEEGRK